MTPATLTPDQEMAAERAEQWYEDGLRAARSGVLHTETWWPQPRKDAYAAGWRLGNARSTS